MKIYFDALGCPKALVDAERMCFFLEEAAHTLVPVPEEADAIIVNTCGFIESAKQESINAILAYSELKKNKPSLRIIMSGCLSERYRNEILKELPEVESAVGVRNLRKILDTLTTDSGDNLDAGEFRDADFVTAGKNRREQPAEVLAEVEAVAARAGDRRCVARVGVAHHARARIGRHRKAIGRNRRRSFNHQPTGRMVEGEKIQLRSGRRIEDVGKRHRRGS